MLLRDYWFYSGASKCRELSKFSTYATAPTRLPLACWGSHGGLLSIVLEAVVQMACLVRCVTDQHYSAYSVALECTMSAKLADIPVSVTSI